MAKLIVTDARGNSNEIILDKERVSIGWFGDNDIRPSDRAVSGKHALITTTSGEFTLEDLGTSKGTQVNGEMISRHVLNHGDLISIGRTTLRFEREPAEQTAGTPAPAIGSSGTFGASAAANDIVMRSPQPSDNAAAPVSGKLEMISGPHSGWQLDLNKALTTIGRTGAQAAAITRRADGFYIGAAGGGEQELLKVNGIRVDAPSRKLSSGDTIEFSGARMTFVSSS